MPTTTTTYYQQPQPVMVINNNNIQRAVSPLNPTINNLVMPVPNGLVSVHHSGNTTSVTSVTIGSGGNGLPTAQDYTNGVMDMAYMAQDMAYMGQQIQDYKAAYETSLGAKDVMMLSCCK